MDEDPNYSSLVFKTTAVTQKEQNDDQTIYSEVKKKPVTTEPNREEEQKICSKVKPEVSGTSASEAETAAKRRTRVLLVCLGTLCVLLMGAVVVLLVLLTTVRSPGAAVEELTAKNQNCTDENKVLVNEKKQLMEAQINLTKQTEELRKERNHLNRSLEVILTFDSFPVKTFCPNKKCQLCQAGWILFQDKCYLFYNESLESAWKTWDQSRQYCQNNSADLVVINNLQEQQFVGNLTKYYLDKWHGFWLGLRNLDNNWVWVDGHTDTLGFWGSKNFENESVLLVPGNPPAQSWRRIPSGSLDKFICERDALIWST